MIKGLSDVEFKIDVTEDASNYFIEHYPKLLQLIKGSFEQRRHYFVSHNLIKIKILEENFIKFY